MLTGPDPAALVVRMNCCSVRTPALIQLLLARIEKLISAQLWPSVEGARNRGAGADRGQAEGRAASDQPFEPGLELLVVTFSQRVQCVDHQLEDGVPQGGVVERR